MLDVEGQKVGVVFVQAAVFTAVASQLPDEGPEERRSSFTWRMGEELASL
jgi:hypothetical protein